MMETGPTSAGGVSSKVLRERVRVSFLAMDRWEATDKTRYPDMIDVVEEDPAVSRLKPINGQKESPHAHIEGLCFRKPH